MSLYPREFTDADVHAAFIRFLESEVIPEHREENGFKNSDCEGSRCHDCESCLKSSYPHTITIDRHGREHQKCDVIECQESEIIRSVEAIGLVDEIASEQKNHQIERIEYHLSPSDPAEEVFKTLCEGEFRCPEDAFPVRFENHHRTICPAETLFFVFFEIPRRQSFPEGMIDIEYLSATALDA